MCNRYGPTPPSLLPERWRVREPQVTWLPGPVFPRAQGLFIRAAEAEHNELVTGQWGLIPWFAKAAKLPYSTNNARFEGIAAKASFKQPWLRGQRCIIPADWFDEPCWETGRNVWWRFRRTDGQPWGLAGLWARWADPSSGELLESYTMLTLNADAHPLMSRMHKPDPKLGPDQQDKRSVVPIAMDDVDTWLHGSTRDAASLVRLCPTDQFVSDTVSP